MRGPSALQARWINATKGALLHLWAWNQNGSKFLKQRAMTMPIGIRNPLPTWQMGGRGRGTQVNSER